MLVVTAKVQSSLLSTLFIDSRILSVILAKRLKQSTKLAPELFTGGPHSSS